MPGKTRDIRRDFESLNRYEAIMYPEGKFLRWGKHPGRINSQKRRGFFIEKPQHSSIGRRNARGGNIGAVAQRLLHDFRF